jgi:hypothetical protein
MTTMPRRQGTGQFLFKFLKVAKNMVPFSDDKAMTKQFTKMPW